MKKTSTKLFLAAATLGLAAASTIGSTYAWFTINGSASVTGIDMKVVSDTGVFIKEHSAQVYDTKLEIPAATFQNMSWNAVTPDFDETSNTLGWKNVDLTNTLAADDTQDHPYTLKSITPVAVDGKAGVYKDSLSETAAYYKLDLDIKLTVGYDIKVEALSVESKDKNGNAVAISCDAKNVIRVGALTYATDGAVAGWTVYRLGATNLSQDTATAQFKSTFGLTHLNDNAKDSEDLLTTARVITAVNNATAVQNYSTERVTFFVWYEGTSWECANDIFGQSVTFSLKIDTQAKA